METKWIVLISVLAGFALVLGVINYLRAALIEMSKKTGKINMGLFIFMQILMTALYLLPSVILCGYAITLNVNPVFYVRASWYIESLYIFGALFIVMHVVGIILLSKRKKNYYTQRQAFMYAINHRVIISYIICAIAILICWFGIKTVNYYDIKPITSFSEIEQYKDRDYLALDISNIEHLEAPVIETSNACETLLLKGSVSRNFQNLSIITSAKEIIFEDLIIINTDGVDLLFNDESELQMLNSTITGKIVFSENAVADLSKSKISGSIWSSKDLEVSLSDNADITGDIIFLEQSQSFKCTGEIQKTEEESKAIELRANLDFSNVQSDYSVALKNVSLVSNQGIVFENYKLTLSYDGKEGFISSQYGNTTIKAESLHLIVDGILSVNAPVFASDKAAILVNSQLEIEGSGELSVTGACPEYSFEKGGTAIKADSLSCIGSITLNAYGGKGGTGLEGSIGATGTRGQKGNNESQGKHSIYGYNGHPGGTGGKGGTGGQGADGGTAIELNNMPEISEQSSVTAYAGEGGKGGRGGTGGTGGRGGDGGDDDRFSILWIDDMSGGNGGPGGSGGDGGDGGAGGNPGQSIVINGEAVIVDRVTYIDGNVGEQGDTGYKGSTGSSGSHGDAGAGG